VVDAKNAQHKLAFNIWILEYMMKRASFISIEDEGSDLILSFALEDEALGVRSLILLRSPKFESLMSEEERGVKVSLEGQTAYEEDSMLVRVVISSKTIEISTQSELYQVDLSKVDEEELNFAYSLLQKMNFDKKFALTHA